MIDTMFQEGTDKALDDRVRRPLPEQAPDTSFSFKQLAKAPFQGLAGGALDVLAARSDEAGGFGQVMAATGAMSGGGMFALPSDAERAQDNAAHNKLMTQGLDMSSPAGDALRQQAKDILPDPQTTHASAQIVAGLTSFGAQAVGAGMSGPAGLVNLGMDQALTESDRLRLQGVDEATRTQAGAVAGVAAAGSLLLPMSGATKVIRAAKGAAGGVAATAGQSEAERLILEHGGYDKIASQYDPLDPVSLTLGALVPAGFGVAFGHGAVARVPTVAPAALHDVVRAMESNGQRYTPDGSLLTSPKGAQGEMQVVPGTATDPGFGVKPAKDSSPEELARVGHDYLDAMFKRYGGDQQKALAAYNAGPGAVDRVLLTHPDDWLAHLPDETQSYVARGAQGHEALRTAAADPDVQSAVRVQQTADAIDSARLTPDDDLAGMDRHTQAVETASDQMARGESVEVAEIVQLRDRMAPAEIPPESALGPEIHPAEEGVQSRDTLQTQRMQQLDHAIQELRTIRQPAEPPAAPNHAAFHEARAEAEAQSANPGQRPPAAEKASVKPDPAALAQHHLDTSTDEIVRQNPDMLVHLDGMDHPVRVADLMDALREEAAGTTRDSKLLEIAAQCAITL